MEAANFISYREVYGLFYATNTILFYRRNNYTFVIRLEFGDTFFKFRLQ